MATHRAAVCHAKGEPFKIESRPTPKPGPGELLIQVKSVAINPADGIMRDTGTHIPTYPAITGFDIAGLVLEVGENVPVKHAQENSGPFFDPGVTRVAAYAAAVWRSCDPDYGAFQEKCLVPWQHALPLADESISWNHAATLPVSVEVPLNAWDAMKIPRLGAAAQNAKKQNTEALLIWGASSSVGTMGVQSACVMRDHPDSPFAAVYATAGAANHEYVKSLGADHVFDYKDPKVVEAVIEAAEQDDIVIRHCFLAMGQLDACQAVLSAFIPDDKGKESEKSKIGSAPPLPQDAKEVDGIETIFVLPNMADEQERLAQFEYWLGTWGREKLASKAIRPSPEPRVVGKGLEALNDALDEVLRGVSCTKLVVEVAQ